MSFENNKETQDLDNKKLHLLDKSLENVQFNIDLDHIIDEGIAIREKNVLRKNVLVFVSFAAFLSIAFIFIYLNLSIKAVFIVQIALTLLTLLSIFILNKIKVSKEVSTWK